MGESDGAPSDYPDAPNWRPAMTVWLINQLINALALMAAVLLLVLLIAQYVLTLIYPDRDIHGLALIINVIIGIFLLVPLSLLAFGAVALHRYRPTGFVYQLLAGAVVGLYGVLISGGLPTPQFIGIGGIGLGAILAAPAVAGLLAARRPSSGTSTATPARQISEPFTRFAILRESGAMNTETLTRQQIADAGLDGWAYLVHYGSGALQTRIHTKNFTTGLQVVNAIGQAAEQMNHHPDLDLRFSRVDVRLTSHDAGGVTEHDLRLARRISDIAAAAGAEAECRSISNIELGLDTPEHEKIAPFWAAVLDGRHVSGDGWADVGDPNQALPLIWFQRSGSEEPRQRWHPDIWVNPAQVRPRIDAALAAGGTLVSDQHAPSFWVLSDPDGNKVCLCTWQDRD
ncbi:4a-hydroxytetrahydrobiopterin dehydratase [Actinopolymorpha alba]|uniref:4a-hydroxytetrahydrobiopterin dehydratase n=1 Tax=Actinopolymorpha alba TaxID=533267 RepID=UPI000376DF64|nr:4a-hydroxytetrahydrobiopterin dehydratase [Actinopolymorpha alba]